MLLRSLIYLGDGKPVFRLKVGVRRSFEAPNCITAAAAVVSVISCGLQCKVRYCAIEFVGGDVPKG